MKFCAISFVPIKTILRIFFVIAKHQTVSCNLGNDRGHGAELQSFISSHHGFLGN